ncbi:50S ribosomal protein L7/L12 [Candidatus Roizmanbacteria bacterium CG22_combo_CG10-13_8_21_14_all_35_9]|uniref:Large ribosomal subunit protein bL12 n=4 Tax=Candidatus Roizmaniibacteriota TaxID=1752723 RepID=A0A2M8F227_9BACT|nr:MAG: 50S ribosomal protein L7/L12 [Candidatus Roizmanbacteria bacterium CG23_combo_of_CG06-09_8_20_14_all_35_49]PIP62479.1 MAG: 50S ribosomal protein L7/L12 [Candidatus Roizmanbacteria bacterium CG22_combo_CG10-13_8_21_14_all_35_9]PIY71041.1 MAG: 50S ribosomal protein L7/L12 [Candidatus Roizmanbacteria bacterium CG_4_10_14_0_8_um_filter_35_28]PJC33327.1 MAG: 50S ribosomal protein L7/L12 [Candidatus Roizmanbacteria bacterium CG_4_9_14_0_2_um_filter_35_15]PJC82950.1 MAG: 50S ribosomal protein 
MLDIKLNEKLQKIATEIEKLTVVEMADLAKYLEEKFGVSAMPVAAAPASASVPQSGTTAAKEEKSIFTVNLTDAGANKLAVIKAVREILPNLGLMDAKKLVESAPKELLKDVKKNAAEEAKKKIETAGGKVELK